MKCVDCQEGNAEEQCKDCGEFYCESCAELRNGFCDCEIPPNIYPTGKKDKKLTTSKEITKVSK